MAIFTLTDAVIWADGLDLTGVTNKVTVKTMTLEKDATVFGGGGYKARLGGLSDVELNASGFLDVNGAAAQDALTFPLLGVANKAFTVAPTSTVGSIAYMAQAVPLSYGLLAANVGDMAPYDLTAKGSGKPAAHVRGMIAKSKGVVSAVGPVGSGVNIDASLYNYLYAALHIFGTPGTTITLTIQSAPNNIFSAPTTQATIGPLTVTGGTFLPRVNIVGSFDTWWRFNVTAITGSFTIAGAIALGL